MKKRIVIHCSGGPASQKAQSIVNYHLRPVAAGGRGWKAPGYHYIIESDGSVHRVWPEDKTANGAKGFNLDSIHICYTGGVDSEGKCRDTRTEAQKRSLRSLVGEIMSRRGINEVVGHRDLSPDLNGDGRLTPDEWIKACPCFDVRTGL